MTSLGMRGVPAVGTMALVAWLAVAAPVQGQPRAIAETKGAASALASLDAARGDVGLSLRVLAEAKSTANKACAESDEADSVLYTQGTSPSEETKKLAREAQNKRRLCLEAKREVKEAEDQLDAAREALRQVASGELLHVPTPSELINIVKAAEKAQEQVEEMRGKLAGLYDAIDKATALALQLTDPNDGEYAKRARSLQSDANLGHALVRAAQRAANDWVDLALLLKRCAIESAKAGPIDPAYENCQAKHSLEYAQAAAAQEVHRRSLAVAATKRTDIFATTSEILIAKTWPTAKERRDAADFAKVLQDYPEAGAPFARDSFQILAGSKSAASVQIGLDSILPNGWRRFTGKASVPLGEGSTTTLFGSADGLANGRRLSLAWDALGYRTRLLGTDSWLWAGGLEVSWGYQDIAYYEDKLAAISEGKKTQKVLPWAFTGSVALHQVDSKNAHLLNFSRQRTFEPGIAKIRCPLGGDGDLGFVDCITGPVGAPTSKMAWVLGYEYRYKGSDFALSPSLAYNTRTEVVSLGLPIYLVKSADDPKRPLNGGLRLDWSSKGKESITGNKGNTLSWGVFVGAPFTLFSGPN